MWYLLSIVVGAILGALVTFSMININVENKLHDKRMGRSGLINPILECVDRPSFGFKSYGMESRLKSFVQKLMAENSQIDIHFYYKDLNNGPVFGIDENKVIQGGSLLKVPLMIGFFKAAESDPQLLERKIKVALNNRREFYEIQKINSADHLQDGKKYSIKELIRAAIVNSDNVAATILEDYREDSFLKNVVQEMDIPISSRIPPYREMTLKDYAGFFRILYNATYLNKVDSQAALQLLSEVKFDEALRAGVPKNVTISHKFGEKLGDNDLLYFNDCGIIYHPERPYLLCVSTMGKDQDRQIKAIREISKFVYDEVDKISAKQ